MGQASETIVIANPESGRGKGRVRARALLAALVGRGGRPRVLWTKGRGHARELARRALEEGARRVAVCGGDGTLQEAAAVLAGADCALAPLPAGRCNDFCRAFGGGWRAEELALALAGGGGRLAAVDLGRVNGRWFCTVGAVGFDAAVSRYVDTMRLPLSGTPAYLYAVLRMLRLYQPPQTRVLWDGGHYEGPLFLAAVGNTATYGNGMPIAPMARPDDGWLDLCLVRPAGFWRVVSLLPAMLKGRHGRASEVSFARTRRVEIDCGQGVEMWADGEPLVAGERLVIEVVPAALRLLLPAGQPGAGRPKRD